METIFLFPTNPDIVISKLLVEIGDTIVECKVMEKGAAVEKYDDAVSAGHTAILLQEKEEEKDVL